VDAKSAARQILRRTTSARTLGLHGGQQRTSGTESDGTTPGIGQIVTGPSDTVDTKPPAARALPAPGFSTEAGQPPARVNVTCVTPLGEEVASTL
jgi:hypothetical protein